MIRSVMDVSTDGLFLNQRRGFLVVSEGKTELAEVPLDDISVLMLSAKGVTVTKDAMMALLERGSPIVLCGKKYSPESIIIPLFGNYEFSGRLHVQLGASLPLKKQLWKQIVQEKIRNQSVSLTLFGLNETARCLDVIAKEVVSGDSTNREGYAAREYWGCFFGKEFSREIDSEEGINVLLNYGYAVLRGMTARAVCSVGLHPSLGLHHKNQKNNYCLVDDLMEPFRPLVDVFVKEFLEEHPNVTELSEWKRYVISKLPSVDVETDRGLSPLIKALEYYAFSLYESFLEKENRLCIPTLLIKKKTERISRSRS